MKNIPVLYNCPLFVLTNCDQKAHCILLSELREPRQTSSAKSGYQINLFNRECCRHRIKLFFDDATTSKRDLDLFAEANWKQN